MMKKLALLLTTFTLVACSQTGQSVQETVFVLPESISLNEENKAYLTDETIEGVKTYEDALSVVSALGETLLAEMDEEFDKLGKDSTAYQSGQRIGAELVVNTIQSSIREAIEESDFELTDTIPSENKEEVVSGLKEVRDTYATQLNDFKSGQSQATEAKKTGGETYQLGETVTFEGEVAITVTAVAYTDERNQFANIEPEQVLVVTYDVDNLSDSDYFIGSEITLYVDGKKASTYPVATTMESISANRSFEGATQAFAITGEGDYELEIKPTFSVSAKAAIMPVTVD